MGAPGKPAAHQYEFFGPYGPAVLLFVLPATLYGLIYGCNAKGCLQLSPSLQIPGFAPGSELWSSSALAVYSGWFALVLLLHLALPGTRADGVVLPNGKRLTYKLNGGPTPGVWPHDTSHAPARSR
jgi:delta14-sterol reductase